MDIAKAQQVVNELQVITRTIYSGHAQDFKSSATMLERKIKPSDKPFIKKDAAGNAIYYIIEGNAGVDIGKAERIIIPPRQTVGEMGMISTVLNAVADVSTMESRTADVYAQEPMRLIVYNYAPLVEILKDTNPELKKLRDQVFINLNRILFRKMMAVNRNYTNVVIGYGMKQAPGDADFPMSLREGLSRFMNNLRTIPGMSILSHDLRGVLLNEGAANPLIMFLEKGKIKTSMLFRKPDKEEVIDDEEEEEEEEELEKWVELNRMEAPIICGESSILNIGAINPTRVETIDNARGYRMPVQKLLRHLQRYPGMFETFFKLLLELNYFLTNITIHRTTNN